MKILAATDGSKYGRWAVEWAAQVPFAVKPTLRVVHVVDIAGLRAPFMIQPLIAGTERYIQGEIKRLEAHAKAAKKEAEAILKESGLSGTVVTDRGGVTETIMKHAKRGVNVLSIGSRGLDALDRFMLGSVSNYAIHQIESRLHHERGHETDAEILRTYRSLNCDLLVMGAYSRGHLRERILGGVTHEMLVHQNLPVFALHG